MSAPPHQDFLPSATTPLYRPPGYRLPAPPIPPAPHRRRRWAAAALAATLGVVAGSIIGAGAAAGWFTTYMFDQRPLQEGVRGILVDDYGLVDVGWVTCPPNQKVVTGRQFTCTVPIDRVQMSVKVVVTSSDGHYTVSRPEER